MENSERTEEALKKWLPYISRVEELCSNPAAEQAVYMIGEMIAKLKLPPKK